jgi:nucleotide sugar dehydrogenase
MVNIGIVGLGYVGLPLAIAFAKAYPSVVGFDINVRKVDDLKAGIDVTGEVDKQDLINSTIKLTAKSDDLKQTNFFIVTVPTPIDQARRPDLNPVRSATEIIGSVLKRGDIVVYESTVYPGVTEEICGQILEKVSGLRRKDFSLGYSPERINPGDKIHRLESIVKVVSADKPEVLDVIAQVYGTVVKAGIYKAPSIKVAEAAKAIENTQRDLNIAFMNELSIIFDKMGIRTADVLKAAGTKWNFLDFRPGLVGGHCIGVDPYYLTYKAEELGYNPQVILAGRRINDSMGKYVAEQTVKQLSRAGKKLSEAKVGIYGITFKENVPDLRNSRVPDIIRELKEYGINAQVTDVLADKEEAAKEYGIWLCDEKELDFLDAIILAVPHKEYLRRPVQFFQEKLKSGQGIFIDIKSIFQPDTFAPNIRYWSL